MWGLGLGGRKQGAWVVETVHNSRARVNVVGLGPLIIAFTGWEEAPITSFPPPPPPPHIPTHSDHSYTDATHGPSATHQRPSLLQCGGATRGDSYSYFDSFILGKGFNSSL